MYNHFIRLDGTKKVQFTFNSKITWIHFNVLFSLSDTFQLNTPSLGLVPVGGGAGDDRDGLQHPEDASQVPLQASNGRDHRTSSG